ncbi:hypothetical protein BGZ61DRAFT_469847 [Ilyonectria robusta]|uniref:uncharacterized protein n=1 Tax=Ilyonectria robusta TaxID=1079257 RepID=UPI001E8CC08D|nr:uncharacterized protein BGZ61DRAFT_469847 [Ilyonectria robusta]KAH8647634.1 hypothetical protein BGZ61DRAFT_469847 [Ilyonectria robusta]
MIYLWGQLEHVQLEHVQPDPQPQELVEEHPQSPMMMKISKNLVSNVVVDGSWFGFVASVVLM